jgi:hypothetical protein
MPTRKEYEFNGSTKPFQRMLFCPTDRASPVASCWIVMSCAEPAVTVKPLVIQPVAAVYT